MILSRLILTGEQLHNPYEIHRALWQTFPDSPEQDRDFLFRIEKRGSRRVQVLLQSRRQIKENAKDIQILGTKIIELNLPDAGRQLRFLLMANPTKTIRDEHGRLDNKGEIKKCRVPLINKEEQQEWLIRKLQNAALPEFVEIDKQSPLNFRKTNKRGKIQPFAFKGVLTIQDGGTLEELVEKGIGPAKAFGCGLLSLARA